MNFFISMVQWYNIVFFAPCILSIVYISITVLSGLADGDDNHDGHNYDDGSSDDGDDSDDSDSDEHNHNNHFSLGVSMLDILNLRNRCPKFLAFSMLFLFWGVIGLGINRAIINFPGIIFICAFAGNVLFSGFISILLVRLIAPVIASTIPGSPVIFSENDFIGKKAKVSTILDRKNGGMVIIELNGSQTKVSAILVPDYEGPSLKSGEEVLIIEKVNDIFLCSVIS